MLEQRSSGVALGLAERYQLHLVGAQPPPRSEAAPTASSCHHHLPWPRHPIKRVRPAASTHGSKRSSTHPQGELKDILACVPSTLRKEAPGHALHEALVSLPPQHLLA